MSHSQVLVDVERRRWWSDDQKRAIVAAAFAPGAVVSTVARQADISGSVIYRWRRKFRASEVGFSRIVVAQETVGTDHQGDALEVLIGTTTIRIPGSTRPDLAAAVVSALVRR